MQKKKIGLIFLALIACVTFFWRNQMQTSPEGIYVHLKPLKGEHAETYEGQYTIVHFWAKWCEPCAEEIPDLVGFAKKLDQEGLSPQLKVVAVSLDEDIESSRSILPSQGRDLPKSFVLLSDPKQTSAEAMGSYQFPESYLVDPEGKVLEKWVGPQKWDQPEVYDYFVKRIGHD